MRLRATDAYTLFLVEGRFGEFGGLVDDFLGAGDVVGRGNDLGLVKGLNRVAVVLDVS